MNRETLIQKLKDDIPQGRVVIIAGTGVSIAACGNQQIENHPVACWAGVLQHGLEYRRTLGVADGTQDGFEIARRDLKLRGPGELLGTRQAGLHRLKVADLGRDGDLLTAVEDTGRVLLRRYPECVDAIIRRWLGDALHYGSV